MGSSTPVVEPDDNPSILRQALVDQLKQAGYIHAPSVEAAFRAVPRHLFVPKATLEDAYQDQSIPTKYLDGILVSSSSQPAIMAIMLEQLALGPGHRVLEIGAGTGYNAALMAHIVGETGQVVTVDIDEDIVAGAQAHLAEAGFERVQVVCGDGGEGYPPASPYDRIILTVGAWDITPAWQEQLRPDGRLVLPLSFRGPQLVVAFEREDNHLASVRIAPCGFMHLRGTFAAGPGTHTQLGSEPGLSLWTEQALPTDPQSIYTWVTGPYHEHATTLRMQAKDFGGSLHLWLAAQESGYCNLLASGEAGDKDGILELFRVSSQTRYRSTVGLLDKDGLCVLARTPDSLAMDPSADEPFELFVRSFGKGDGVVNRLMKQVVNWDAAGRPTAKNLVVRVYPRHPAYAPTADEFVIPKRWTQLVLHWHNDDSDHAQAVTERDGCEH